MSLSPGARLGPYEILAAIGAGGMGEVYRARDTKLDRHVAIKMLPDAFAYDVERVSRFQREAKTLASLNHPNIGGIYGLEDSDGVTGLVLELVEGPTLADRIAQGPIPVVDALPIARQIAEALEAAHEQGIIHRDLKPANIKIRPDGTVKVLDFGLAKALGSNPVGVDLSLSPTITSPAMTMGGVILGTAAYMSPEQAKGKPIDKRTDIWAFGCVLFEMLTGRRAFEGEDVSETLAVILRGEPDWAALPSEAPVSLVEVLKRCVDKDRKRRIADMADVRYELERPSAAARVSYSDRSLRAIPYRKAVAWMCAGLISGAIVSFAVLRHFAPAPPSPQVVRFTFSPPEGWELWAPGTAIGQSSIAVSPDGSRVAFVARQAARKGMLWIRPLDQLDSKPLPGTEGATSPFWSPDGRSLGFFADGKLKRIEVEGGPPTTLSDSPNERGGSWSQGDVIIFAPLLGQALQKISVKMGGAATPASVLQKDGRGHARPSFLPDGRHFVYRATVGGRTGRSVYLGSVDTLDHVLLMESEAGEHIYSQGHLLFLRGGALMAQRLEAGKWSLSGQPYPIIEGVAAEGNAEVFGASSSGVIAYQPGRHIVETELLWLDRSGKQLGVLGTKGNYNDLELSPDGKSLAVTMGDPSDIWVYDVARGVPNKVTSGSGSAEFPIVWSADSRTIFFSSQLAVGNGQRAIYQKDLTTIDAPKKLGPEDSVTFPLSAARGGGLLYQAASLSGSPDLWWLPASGERRPTRVMQTPYAEVRAKLSPNERWVAYSSDRTGTPEVFVTSFPEPGQEHRISVAGGTYPRWRRDGREIYYLDPDSQLMAVGVDGTTSEFKVGEAKPLFKFLRHSSRSSYDVSADGQRFIVNHSGEQRTQEPIVVILNWPSALTK